MIFEFVGLPATGKTTILRELDKNNIAERLSLDSKQEIIWWFLTGLVRYPIQTIQGLILVGRYRPKLYVFWNYFIVRYARVYKATWYNKKTWIVDEPPMQNLYSLMAKSYQSHHLMHMYRWSFSPGHLIYFSLPEDERLERRKLRNRQMSNEFDEGWLHRTRVSDAFLAKQLKNRKDATVVTYPTFESVAHIIKNYAA